MKTQAKLITSICLMALFLAYSCKDKENEMPQTEPENQVAKMFKAHSWRINETFWLNKSNILYGYIIPTCYLDDKFDYLNGDLYLKDPSTELCSGQTQKNDTLGWKLINNNSQLEINNKGTVVNYNILTVNTDSLITSTISPNGDTFVYLYLKYK